MWDIFCAVVDNYGDVGTCWRLARQLAAEYRLDVRLWVDDLPAFSRLERRIDPAESAQRCDGVEVRAWSALFPDVAPGDVVIEGFGCTLPERFVAAMAARVRPPVWVNLEYLTAEDWAAGVHGMPSRHPRLPLDKRFFVPGFDVRTGGVIRERGLAAARAAFQVDADAQAAFWRALDVPRREAGELRFSMFCYSGAPLPALLDSWAARPEPVTCVVPEGLALAPLRDWFGPAAHMERGTVRAFEVPFLAQPDYDRLLWSCDGNFVRGEDSFVRAQWAARPLIWQAYPQADRAHHAKVDAFLGRYCGAAAPEVAAAIGSLNRAWNGMPGECVAVAWDRALAVWPAWAAHSAGWATGLAEMPHLAEKLVNFVGEQV